MADVQVKELMQSAVITGITVAAAISWQSFFADVIKVFVPAGDATLYSKFLTAVLTTIVVVILVVLFLQLKKRADRVVERVKKRAR